jgi:hypothetical protein
MRANKLPEARLPCISMRFGVDSIEEGSYIEPYIAISIIDLFSEKSVPAGGG